MRRPLLPYPHQFPYKLLHVQDAGREGNALFPEAVGQLRHLGHVQPQVTLLAHELRKKGIGLPEGILTVEELADALAGSR